MSDDFDLDGPVPSRTRRVLIYSRDWIVAILLTLFGFWAISKWRAPDLPEFAPDFTLQTTSGEEIQLSSLRGKTVVLNFWTTWCHYCKKETPDFVQFADENPDIPVLGIAISQKAFLGETEEAREKSFRSQQALIRATSRRWKMTYPTMLADQTVVKDYKIDTFPTTIVVAPDGKIANIHVGQMLPKQLNVAVTAGASGCSSVPGY